MKFWLIPTWLQEYERELYGEPPFYNSKEYWSVPMKNQMTNQEAKKRGRPNRYLTVERFNEFVSNDFWHVQQYARWSLWISLTILAAIIVKFIVG